MSDEMFMGGKGLSAKLPTGQSEQTGKYFRITEGDNSLGQDVKDDEVAIKSIVERSGWPKHDEKIRSVLLKNENSSYGMIELFW